MSKIIVIGGGAAGMIAAYFAASNGNEVHLVEKNEKLGKKIYITGKGRCNLTNASDMDVLFSNVMSNPKFLYSAFYSFDNNQVIDFFESHGMKTKIERGNRVFPVSDHSSDVIITLQKALKEVGVKITLNTKVAKILTENNKAVGVSYSDKTVEEADAVILATGGMSYQSTGSTGDGYEWAKNLGHKIMEPIPSLVPFNTKEEWVTSLQGLSLKNSSIRLKKDGKTIYEDFGEMLFTHFGVSGPMILSASANLKKYSKSFPLTLEIDLKPALTIEQLDKRVLRDFEEQQKKQIKNSLGKLLPAKLIPVVIDVADVDPDKKIYDITKEERMRLVQTMKSLVCTVVSTRGWNEAIITKGGISVKDVDPSTMESKVVQSLYICGEVLDLDAMTGGYNLQIAWSTGYLAGICAQ